ncbi:LysR family transcriptional regulator [Arthrobacter mangrovi]|uniref:LysR family transcriptional regulator n=1 Tax=Arthrobacter mangrovi TaxID=2966350 RepID=A0ABQ5MZZ0_9MICC|nr:LysR family transcriptional regulator [Arthrobacter mangrovi]GLB69552.1 LysR family transcriptional regulator [Arthrobacter mangrovi]
MAYDLSQAGVDARLLAYFLAVVDAGTITRAAKQLGIAQPSLSLAVRELERQFGSPVFDRVGRRLVLNETGHALAAVARQIVGALATARATVDARTSLTSGKIRISAPPSLTVHPLNPAIEEFSHRYPGVRVSVLAQAAESVQDLVLDGEIDMALVIEEPGVAEYRGLVVREIGLHESVAVLPPDMPVPPTGRLTRASLASFPLIVSEPGTRLRTLVDEMAADGLPVRIAAEVAHREATIPLVVDGLGAALLPWSIARLAGRLGATVIGVDPPIINRMLLIHRPELTPAAAAFVDTAFTHRDNALVPEPSPNAEVTDPPT